VTVQQSVSETSADASVTPAAEFRAWGDIWFNTFNPCCTNTLFSMQPQTISPTALSMDPLMNSVRFTATLSSSSGPVQFDLTAVEATSTYHYGPCQTGCANAWLNPGTNDVNATTYNYAAVERYGYTVSGIAGSPLLPTTSTWGYARPNCPARSA
jgi:hypothetical protein